MARSLIHSFSPGFLDLVLDPDPDGPPTALRTAIRAWSCIPADSTHHLVLEDDARPSAGFLSHAQRVASAAPDAAIAFYTNWQSRNGAAVRLGALTGARWVTSLGEYTPTVALLLPAPVGQGFGSYARANGGTWPDDVVMARYLRHSRVTTYLTVPNLVEHDDAPSTSGYGLHGLRRSACYCELDTDVDWSLTNTLHPDMVPVFDCGLAQCVVRGRDDSGWLAVRSDRCLQRLGLDVETCLGELESALKSAPELVQNFDDRLSPRIVGEFWQTAYLLGAVGRRAGRFAELEQELAFWAGDPLVDEALGTLALGGICSNLTAAEVPRFREPLRTLAGWAQHAGARRYERAGTRRTRKIVVAGGDQPLARHLVADLADRGYSVSCAELGSAGPAGLDSPLHGAEVVVHVTDPCPPGLHPQPRSEMAGSPEMIHHILELARSTGVGHVLQVDVSGAARTEPVPLSDEQSRVLASDADGPALTVLRLAVPYGPEMVGYSIVNDLVRHSLIRQPMVVRQPPVEPFQLIHVWDIANLVARVIANQQVAGSMDVCGTEPMSLAELATSISENIGRIQIDVISSGRPTMAGPVLSGDRTRAQLGWAPAVSLEDGIKTLGQWLLYDCEG
jgi:nucleoside-diphosphate-sugar epimerase